VIDIGDIYRANPDWEVDIGLPESPQILTLDDYE